MIYLRRSRQNTARLFQISHLKSKIMPATLQRKTEQQFEVHPFISVMLHCFIAFSDEVDSTEEL
jgi:hypothetical protein